MDVSSEHELAKRSWRYQALIKKLLRLISCVSGWLLAWDPLSWSKHDMLIGGERKGMFWHGFPFWGDVNLELFSNTIMGRQL
jgi:hypothetical protein